MAGKNDLRAQAADWRVDLFGRMRGQTERAAQIIEGAEMKAGDVAAADRHCRAVANVVRAAKTVCSLLPEDDDPDDTKPDERELDDDGDDDDPAELVRAHAELQSCLDGVRATVEAKRLEGWHVVRRAGPQGDPGDG